MIKRFPFLRPVPKCIAVAKSDKRPGPIWGRGRCISWPNNANFVGGYFGRRLGGGVKLQAVATRHFNRVRSSPDKSCDGCEGPNPIPKLDRKQILI